MTCALAQVPTAVAGSCVVVVPAYRPNLSGDEILSLRHLEHFLPTVDKYLAMPDTLDFGRDGYREARFAPAFFRGIAGYNRLMLSDDFYARFASYEYILIHQLDALILHSDIERFVALDVDYLGAPWVDHDIDGLPRLTHVGNGGLSLRRVDAFRRLLRSPAPKTTAGEYYRERYEKAPRRHRPLGLLKAGLVGLGIQTPIRAIITTAGARGACPGLAAEARDYGPSGAAEDWFISAKANRYYPGFTFGSLDQALEFAFEKEPRYCFEKAGGRMPFGTHAWRRYDSEFWAPHLLTA